MKARKLPSGRWNCAVYDYTDDSGNKHQRSFTANTREDAEYQALLFLQTKKQQQRENKKRTGPDERTVREVVDQYIKDCADPNKGEPRSISTINGYKKSSAEAFQDLMDRQIKDLSSDVCQQAIWSERRRISSRTGKQISVKTLHNEWMLIAAALKKVAGVQYQVTLPRLRKEIKILPAPEEIIAAVVGTPIELPCLLAMWMSLRESEVLALTDESIKGGYIVVDRAIIDGQLVRRTKTDASTRALPIPPYIQGLIDKRLAEANEKDEPHPIRLAPYTHDVLYKRFKKAMLAKGYNITYHDLRHVFASVSRTMLGLPDKEVQTTGGWSSPVIMDRVYTNMTPGVRTAADKAREEYWTALISEHKTEPEKSPD